MQGSIVSKKAGVINMPSWTGVVNDAQASAIAAYILAGFPQVSGVAYDANPATAADIYTAYACITCHGQVGANATPAPAPNPDSPDKAVPLLRNPADNVTPADFLDHHHGGLDPAARQGRRDLHAGLGPDPLDPAGGQDPEVHPGRTQGQVPAGARGRVAAAARVRRGDSRRRRVSRDLVEPVTRRSA